MTKERKLEILKQALLLEKRGKAFYQKVAEHTDHHAVKSLFSQMAEEEDKHIQALLSQYKAIKELGLFNATDSSFFENPTQTADEILTDDIVKRIANSDYESAAISAAISMEEKAVEVYANRAKQTTDSEEKKLYTWLAEWEKQHLDQLLKIDQITTEKIWMDNSFWPF
ncbi:MAG: hypothetical protein Kow0029_32120 [Candidatus Rifleibacteriota bacterium]